MPEARNPAQPPRGTVLCALSDIPEPGGKTFRYIPCLNDDDAWIAALGGIAQQHLSGWPTQVSPDAEALAAQKQRAMALGAES